MRVRKISIDGNVIQIGSKKIEFEYPVLDGFLIGEKIIILFDPDAYTSNFGQFRNLIAVDLDGKQIWEGERPTTSSPDRYYCIKSKKPLIVSSTQSYNCKIDLETGKIIESEFYK